MGSPKQKEYKENKQPQWKNHEIFEIHTIAAKDQVSAPEVCLVSY